MLLGLFRPLRGEKITLWSSGRRVRPPMVFYSLFAARSRPRISNDTSLDSLPPIMSALDLFRLYAILTIATFLQLAGESGYGKTVCASQIVNDSEIPGMIVRTSTLPDELGRMEYLLSDKTLTQNGTPFSITQKWR